jgi:hypothetical protein
VPISFFTAWWTPSFAIAGDGGRSVAQETARALYQEGLISAECYAYGGHRLLLTYKHGKHLDWMSLILNLEKLGREVDDGLSETAHRAALIESKGR